MWLETIYKAALYRTRSPINSLKEDQVNGRRGLPSQYRREGCLELHCVLRMMHLIKFIARADARCDVRN